MIYLDTNVIGYAIENHFKYGSVSKKILFDVENKKIEAVCSALVLSELISVLVRLNKLAGRQMFSIKNSVKAVLSLPITWYDMDMFTIGKASEYSFNVSGMDYIHIATMEINSITKIISAHSDFDKIDFIKGIDPLEYNSKFS